jgi:hypothetical protein
MTLLCLLQRRGRLAGDPLRSCNHQSETSLEASTPSLHRDDVGAVDQRSKDDDRQDNNNDGYGFLQ